MDVPIIRDTNRIESLSIESVMGSWVAITTLEDRARGIEGKFGVLCLGSEQDGQILLMVLATRSESLMLLDGVMFHSPRLHVRPLCPFSEPTVDYDFCPCPVVATREARSRG